MADPREPVDLVQVTRQGCWVMRRELTAALAAQGLHIVTAHERAVLDAMADVDEDTLRDRLNFKRLTLEDRALYRAELARRAAKETK